MSVIKFLLLSGLIAMMSCSDLEDEDRIAILHYIDSRNLISVDTAGVYVVISKSGDQNRPSENATITMSYKGYYTDGTIFDRSPAESTIALRLNAALPGLRLGLSKMGKMSEGTILIPSRLGYGSNPPFGIRKNAILIYDVKIEDF